MTFSEFIKANNLTVEFKRIPERTSSLNDWIAGSKHYSYDILQRVGSAGGGHAFYSILEGEYTMGPGCKGLPKAEDLLCCLQMDVQGVYEGGSFEDWCGDFGYDSDSRKALAVWEACVEIFDLLNCNLTDDEMEAFLECEEG